MRFREFLLEAETGTAFDGVIAKIKTDCRQYLGEIKGGHLYRGLPGKIVNATGVKNTNNSISLTPHPKNRKAKDSSADFNFMFNAAMEALLQIADIRSRSIFITGDNAIAEMYGEVHYFYPRGQIQYIWSPKVHDSFEDQGKMFLTPIAKGMGSSAIGVANMFKDQVAANLTPHEWLTSTGSDNESAPHADVVALLRNTFKKLYKSDGLDKASSSLNEILFYETAGYYMVPVSSIMTAMVSKGLVVENKWDFAAMDKFMTSQLA